MMSDRLRAHAAMLLTALTWGVSITLVKLALEEISPLEVALLRYFVAAVGFLIVLLIGRRNLPSIPRRHWPRTLAAAATGMVGYGVVVSIGLQNSTSSVTGLINTVGPIFTLILSCIFLGESLTPNKMIGIAVAMCGVVLIVVRGGGDANLTVASAIGPLIVATAILLWSVYSIIAKPLLADYAAIPFTGYITIIGALMMAPIAVVVDWGGLSTVSLAVWVAVAFAGIGSTLVGQLLWNYSLSVLDASEVSVYLYLVPVAAVISAILLLGEVITVYFVLGGVMVITGVALTNRAKAAAMPAARTTGDPMPASPQGASSRGPGI